MMGEVWCEDGNKEKGRFGTEVGGGAGRSVWGMWT